MNKISKTIGVGLVGLVSNGCIQYREPELNYATKIGQEELYLMDDSPRWMHPQLDNERARDEYRLIVVKGTKEKVFKYSEKKNNELLWMYESDGNKEVRIGHEELTEKNKVEFKKRLEQLIQDRKKL